VSVTSSTAPRLWYHTLDLPSGATPGWFDLRGQVSRLPWPEVRGKRCLDVATYDGFYAFELERRGAAEVVATDIPGHEHWDWPVRLREQGPGLLAEIAGEKGGGFEVARAELGSSVSKREINVYELAPDAVGQFDVVVCGSLLLHLRDPVRALEAIRSVVRPGGGFMSIETVSLPLSRLFPHKPTAELCDRDEPVQWWTVNTAGHRRLLEAAGFEVLRGSKPFAVPFGPAHPSAAARGIGGGGLRAGLRAGAVRAGRQLLLGSDGVPHAALLARPHTAGS
jgi:tRNA (mo5U34)-methyltransferase